MKHLLTFFVGLIGLIIVDAILIFNAIDLNRNCTGHLKRAADANTIELAEKELGIAVRYLEDNNLTSGYTSAVYNTPDEDITFWYNNLKASLDELQSISPDASVLEKTNMLMKLRETLLDNDEHGTSITVPTGLSRYPHNLLIGSFFWIFLFITIIGTVLILGN